ncbi:5020_t:CDS:2, partial [Acaulospora colombiana]
VTAKLTIGSNAAFRGLYARSLTSQATEKASNAAKGTLSKIAGFQKPIVYNARVLKEIAKEVYVKENLRPPSAAQISEVWEGLKSIRPSDINKLSSDDIKTIGVRSLECLGFFIIGEVIGRRGLIGYNS